MTDFIQVITTTATREEAMTIAREAVRTRAAACAQVSSPMTSVYWWEGQVEEAEEVRVALKTTRAAYERLEAVIRTLHSYEVPEIVALPMEEGGRDYLAWVKEEVEEG